MNIFNSNIRLLRKRLGRTQDDVAFSLKIPRPTYNNYENEIAQPNIELLVAFSKYFKISIDTLVKVDLSKLPESQLSQLERGYDIYLSGNELRVLATTIGDDNEENIELVPERAKAGYTTGFADPEYIKVLPTFRMPFLSKEKKYRTFEITGDSMIPIPNGSYVTGEFVQNWTSIRNNYPYIVLTLDDGIVFKVVENQINNNGKLVLHSLNPMFEPFEIDMKDVREMWKFVNYISSEMPEPNQMKEQKLMDAVSQLQRQVTAIQTKLEL